MENNMNLLNTNQQQHGEREVKIDKPNETKNPNSAQQMRAPARETLFSTPYYWALHDKWTNQSWTR